jgi:hypothetical protein
MSHSISVYASMPERGCACGLALCEGNLRVHAKGGRPKDRIDRIDGCRRLKQAHARALGPWSEAGPGRLGPGMGQPAWLYDRSLFGKAHGIASRKDVVQELKGSSYSYRGCFWTEGRWRFSGEGQSMARASLARPEHLATYLVGPLSRSQPRYFDFQSTWESQLQSHR